MASHNSLCVPGHLCILWWPIKHQETNQPQRNETYLKVERSSDIVEIGYPAFINGKQSSLHRKRYSSSYLVRHL